MDDGPELVGTDDTSANLNLESIPPDIVIEIFSYLRADEIPSMRLISRYIASCLHGLLRWLERASQYSRRSITLVSDDYDVNKISLAVLKKVVLRTDALERTLKERNPLCIRPICTWRHPDPNESMFTLFGLRPIRDFHILRTKSGAQEIWDLRREKLVFREDGLSITDFFVFPDLPGDETMRVQFDAGSRSSYVFIYSTSFPTDSDPSGLISISLIKKYSVSNCFPPAPINIFPILIDEKRHTIAYLSLSSDDTLLLCLIFGESSRYCIIDCGLSDVGNSSDIEYFPGIQGEGNVILSTVGPRMYEQRLWNLDQLLGCSEPFDAQSTISISGTAGNVELLTPTIASTQTWEDCCVVPGGKVVHFTPKIFTPLDFKCSTCWFRTSYVSLWRTREPSANGQSSEIAYYVVQFYCSDSDPISKHRLVFRLRDPYLRPNFGPYYDSDFDRLFWIEKVDNGAQLALRMLTYPFTGTTSADELHDDCQTHHEEPVVCTLDIPQHILRNIESIHMMWEFGSIHLGTNDGAIHEFRYA